MEYYCKDCQAYVTLEPIYEGGKYYVHCACGADESRLTRVDDMFDEAEFLRGE